MTVLNEKIEHGSQMAKDRVMKLNSDFGWALVGLLALVVFLGYVAADEIFDFSQTSTFLIIPWASTVLWGPGSCCLWRRSCVAGPICLW